MNQDVNRYLDTIRSPGLTPESRDICRIAVDLSKKIAIFIYKDPLPSIWVAFLGGTGTGKSTLFNALCGYPLSETGVQRPKTQGPIAYAHRSIPIEKEFPIDAIRIDRRPFRANHSGPTPGAPGRMVIIEHDRNDWSHLILVDTPDLDSIETENREIAEDLYLLADAVVFVASQEKYADGVPSQFFKRVVGEENPYFLLLNKVQKVSTKEDLINIFNTQGISVNKDQIWTIFYESLEIPLSIDRQSGFRDFRTSLFQTLTFDRIQYLKKTQHKKWVRHLTGQIDRLLLKLEKENQACQDWLRGLDRLYTKTSKELIQNETERFSDKSREYLRAEIRKLFIRYDFLAKPRQLIKEIVLIPFRFLGFRKETSEDHHRQAVEKMKEKLDLSPVEAAIEAFNRSVLEELSPQNEESPLFKELRQPSVFLEAREIRNLTWKEQERLISWLEETFQNLSRGIPKGKQWGIYTTSIIWGILLLSLETAIGGGFSMLDMVLDSALAPFVTKGAVELFAYHEIQNIARKLAKRYQQTLLAALNRQREMHKRCLQSLMTPPGAIEYLRELKLHISDDA